MASLNPAKLLEKLNWRYAVKKFDPSKEIPVEIWKALEQALILTPSSYGLQPWKFIVVKDKALRAQLKTHSWNQSQITEASHMVVLASKDNLNAQDVNHFIRRIASVRALPESALKGYQEIMLQHVLSQEPTFNINEWSARQVYIAVGNFLTAAAVLGIDTCPMEGFDPVQYKKILNLEGLTPRCVITAGYRDKNDPYAKNAKVRYPANEVISHI